MWPQFKVEEADFNDVPAGNCDIPDACPVLSVVPWKIWSWKESTKSIKGICQRYKLQQEEINYDLAL